MVLCVHLGGTQLKTTDGGQLEEVALKRETISNVAQIDPAAAAAMQTLEEG